MEVCGIVVARESRAQRGRLANDKNRRALLWCGFCRNQAALLLLLHPILWNSPSAPFLRSPVAFLGWRLCRYCCSGCFLFVLRVCLVYRRFTWRGYSVAEFSNREDMTRAVRELDDTYFADRRIRVDYVSFEGVLECLKRTLIKRTTLSG